MIKKANILLSNGRSVNVLILNLIRDVAKERIPLLTHNVEYTSKMICGKSFWEQLSSGEQKSAGLCMSHLAATGELPLIVAESRHEYPVFYQLK